MVKLVVCNTIWLNIAKSNCIIKKHVCLDFSTKNCSFTLKNCYCLTRYNEERNELRYSKKFIIFVPVLEEHFLLFPKKIKFLYFISTLYNVFIFNKCNLRDFSVRSLKCNVPNRFSNLFFFFYHDSPSIVLYVGDFCKGDEKIVYPGCLWNLNRLQMMTKQEWTYLFFHIRRRTLNFFCSQSYQNIYKCMCSCRRC